MFLRTNHTTPLQILCEFMLNAQGILKGIIDADEKCQGDLQASRVNMQKMFELPAHCILIKP